MVKHGCPSGRRGHVKVVFALAHVGSNPTPCKTFSKKVFDQKRLLLRNINFF